MLGGELICLPNRFKASLLRFHFGGGLDAHVHIQLRDCQRCWNFIIRNGLISQWLIDMRPAYALPQLTICN